MLCMHPDLVRAPRLQPPLQQGCSASGQWLQQLPCAHSMPAPAHHNKSCCMTPINGWSLHHALQVHQCLAQGAPLVGRSSPLDATAAGNAIPQPVAEQSAMC